MIEHAEDKSVERWRRGSRVPLARTLCNRWVDVMRLALPDREVTCRICAKRAAESASHEQGGGAA